MKKKLILSSLAAILLAVIAYVIYQLNKINKAVFQYAGAKIKSISLKRIELTLYMKMVNDGTMSVTVSNQEYDVYLNDKFISHIKNSQPYRIRPGVNVMPLDVYINIADVIKAGWANLSQLLTDKSKVNVSLKGTYDLKIGFIRVGKRPFEQSFNLGQANQ